MKKLLYFAALMLCFSVLFSCSKKGTEEKDNSSILLYVAGNNTLSGYSYDLINQLKEGVLSAKYTDDNQVLLYIHSSGNQPLLCKITRRADGTGIDSTILCVYNKETNSADINQFRKVIEDAERLCPAKHHGLVLWSHATGYLPQGYTHSPDTRSLCKSFGSDYNDTDVEMEIQEIVAALPHHYDFIFFDCCLMGGVEVAYEFKDVCDYIIFSPTEIMAQGFPYYMMMEQLFGTADLEKSLKNIAKEYYDYYMEQYSKTSWVGGTITCLRTSDLKELADFCRPVFERNKEIIPTLPEDGIQIYFRFGWKWFYDLGDIINRIGTADEYTEFCRIMDKMILFKGATPEFLEIQIKSYSGLSTYLPRPYNTKLNKYYKTLKWNQDTQYVL